MLDAAVVVDVFDLVAALENWHQRGLRAGLGRLVADAVAVESWELPA